MSLVLPQALPIVLLYIFSHVTLITGNSQALPILSLHAAQSQKVNGNNKRMTIHGHHHLYLVMV